MAYTKEDKLKFLEALASTLGIVTKACVLTGVPRGTHYRWLEEDSEYAKEARLVDEVAFDFVEDSMYEQIRDKVPSTTIFYLKTKGRGRGYIEKQEHIHHVHEDSLDKLK